MTLLIVSKICSSLVESFSVSFLRMFLAVGAEEVALGGQSGDVHAGQLPVTSSAEGTGGSPPVTA